MAKRNANEIIIRVEGVRKSFRIGGGRKGKAGMLDVLKGITLDIFRGETIAVVGASGAGKSTLLHILGTLDRPTEGRVYYDGEDVFSSQPDALARFRNENVGFVFQFHHLLPEFSARENVAMPALIKGMSRRKALAKAEALLDRVGIRGNQESNPDQMSGGEQQRVAVARALINSPVVVLADEPTGNLDTSNATQIHDMILKMSREQNQTFVIVTHNEKLAKQADRVVRIVDGVVGPADAVRRRPRSV